MNKKSTKQRLGFWDKKRLEYIRTFYQSKMPQVVLDVGCGGNTAYETPFKNSHYIGIDEVLRVLKYRKKHSYNSVIYADFYELPVRENSVDLVISFGSYN